MIKIAITGGIGSGKTVVCDIFYKMGFPVFNADFVAKSIINSNSEVRNQLISLFGKGIYRSDGNIHRKNLADLIFNDKIALEKVNSIIHPKVFSAFNNWSKKQNSPFVIQETAIVFENGHTDRFDKIITVSAPKEVRIERCLIRDNSSKEKIEERMNNQLNDQYKVDRSDFVIYNDNVRLIIPQINNILKKII